MTNAGFGGTTTAGHPGRPMLDALSGRVLIGRVRVGSAYVDGNARHPYGSRIRR